MSIVIEPSYLRVLRGCSNPQQFAEVGNPWVTPADWWDEMAKAQDPLTSTARRRSALDFVRPGTPARGEPVEPQRPTGSRADRADTYAKVEAQRALNDEMRELCGAQPLARSGAVNVTAEDAARFRRTLAQLKHR